MRILFILSFLTFASCDNSSLPKQKGFFAPEFSYPKYENQELCNFKFTRNLSSNIIKTNENFHKLMENRKRNAEERIKQLKNQALKDIKNTSVIIAIESVEKLLKNSLDKSKLDKIYSSSLEETKLALKKKSS